MPRNPEKFEPEKTEAIEKEQEELSAADRLEKWQKKMEERFLNMSDDEIIELHNASAKLERAGVISRKNLEFGTGLYFLNREVRKRREAGEIVPAAEKKALKEARGKVEGAFKEEREKE